MENKNDGKVVPFGKPAGAPAAAANQNEMPPARQITFTLLDGKVIVKTGYLIFMNPFAGVGQADNSVTFLVNPGEILHIALDEIVVPAAAA